MVPLAPECGPDLQFEKLSYVMPSSLTAPLMSDRSSIRKADISVKDKKGGKKDKKESTSGQRTPATTSNAGGGVRASKDRTVNTNNRRASEIGGDYADGGGGAGFGRRDTIGRAEIQSPLLKNVKSNFGENVSSGEIS